MGQTTVYVNGKPDHVYDSGSGSSSPVPNNASQATQAQDAQAASQQAAGKISGGMLPSGGLTAPSGPTPGTANPTAGINAPGVTGNPAIPTAVQNNATGAGVGSSSLNAPTTQAPAALPSAPPSKYDAGLAAAKASGQPAPSDAAAARSAVTSYTPNGQPDTSGVDALISQDPGINSLMQGIVQLLNPQQQTTTLLDDYNSLYKQSGLADINKEIIDADTIINGTEGDIRNEIQTAGGLGTDSQIQAMSLARNKSLLTRYNQLVQMKTDATNQLNTMVQLDSQDKQMAQTRVNNQIDSMFKLADFRQQAISNVQEGFNSLVAKVGYAGAYQAYSQSPQQLAAIEQTMGLGAGGLKNLAAQPDLDRQLKQAQISEANRGNQEHLQYVQGTANQPAGTFNPVTGVFTPTAGGTTTSASALSSTKSNIDSISSLLAPNAMSGVGTNALLRYDPLTGFTGKQQNFLAGVNQIKDQLTLDSLTKAKANGATFGALSDGERTILANSASKLGSWEVKDKKTGDVIGYNASAKDFNAELNKINNYAKLDYTLKGGNPVDVGVQQQSDGTYWAQNSDGSFTKIQ